MKREFITYIHMYIFICRRIREIRQMRLLTEKKPPETSKKRNKWQKEQKRKVFQADKQNSNDTT